jgi:hypothetical protein
MSAIQIDDERVPLIVVTYPDFITPDDYRNAFIRFRELSTRHPRLAYLIDFRNFDPVRSPAPLRRVAGEIFAEFRNSLARTTVCEARVVLSPLSRGILTAFDWITPYKWPCANFPTFEEAHRWIERQLA